MAEQRLSGKNALITGASHGIGQAIALAMAREGANVAFTYQRDEAAAAQVLGQLQELGVKCQAFQVDAGEASAAPQLAGRVLAGFDELHVLVNNVGITTRTGFLETSVEDYHKVMNANLRFPFFLTQAVIAHMLERRIVGSVINVSSISAFKAISQMAHYQSSKAGLSMLSKSLAYEFAAQGIRVNTLSPGLTATQGNRNQWHNDPQLWRERGKDIPLGRAGTPQDHAGAAVFLASDEAAWVTGADIVIDGGEATL
ncbi:SDR family NAD(P)-dependent oxidoreductase [Pseudomonas protegens]|uniref:SDR family NAD(P)-dependent oxidoreductase n=1 Tax=Pseudomonas protegens TaxID=380021 RepID=UPI0022646063|nr:glucose 1-dehydrogenase [Pseudomonas protegens]